MFERKRIWCLEPYGILFTHGNIKKFLCVNNILWCSHVSAPVKVKVRFIKIAKKIQNICKTCQTASTMDAILIPIGWPSLAEKNSKGVMIATDISIPQPMKTRSKSSFPWKSFWTATRRLPISVSTGQSNFRRGHCFEWK